MIKNFNEFLNESTTTDWKKYFLEAVVESLKEGSSDAGHEYDSVDLDFPSSTVTVNNVNVISDDKDYSVLDVTRPTINMDYTVTMKFEFDENSLKQYISPGRNYGLSNVKFEDIFKVKVSSTLEVTIDEIEDFYHLEGDTEMEEVNIDTDFPNEKEFLEDFYLTVDSFMEELCPPIPGDSPLRNWLDKYEEENDWEEHDEEY